MKHTVRILLVIIFHVAISIQGYSQPLTIKSNWQSDWITTPQKDTVKNSWLCFRKTFEIAGKQSGKTMASIAVDSKYWLYINNKLVVFEGQLKRGPTPDDTYYDEVDISSYLQKGKNTIAVLVWFWGRDGFSHNNSGRAGLLFEASNGGSVILRSDDSWKTSVHPAYGFTGAPVPNFRLPEFNIHFDARKDTPRWYTKDFDDKAWPFAIIAGKAGQQPWNRLWKRPVPLWYDSGLLAYQNKSWSQSDTGGVVVMKLPKNLSITPYLKVDAPAGLLIDIRTDNYNVGIGDNGYNVRTEYITKGGIQEFETFGYMNGHEVWYNIPAGVKILELKYRETKYNTQHVGSFHSNDEALNTLWIKSLNTMNVNMRDAIQDPDRERAQWWGDAVTILGEIFYSSDADGVKAIKKSMSNLVEWQKKDGVLFSPIPAGDKNKELPAQMLAAVGDYGFYTYFKYTNDSSFVKYLYPSVKKYLGLWQLNNKGLVVHRKGDWDWFDWGGKVDATVLENAWYYMALDGASKMAEISGFPEDSRSFRDKMQRVKIAFNKEFWRGNSFSSTGYNFYADDRANGLAVVAGLADKDQWKKMRPVLDTTFYAGPYMEKYVLEAYLKMGDTQAGIQRMKDRYSSMIAHDISTLWEGWKIRSKTTGGGSYNHGWSGGPLTLMNQYIGGLAPGEPGYRTIRIFPQPGDLKSVAMGSETQAGFVKVAFENTDRDFSLSIDADRGRTMLVGFPKLNNRSYSVIKINNKVVWKAGQGISQKGVNYKGEQDNRLVFEVPSDKYTFLGIYN